MTLLTIPPGSTWSTQSASPGAWCWVKWWLLAIPQYLVVAVFTGGAGPRYGGGLIGILCLIAGVTLAVTRRYPRPIFDFVMGLCRWCWRVTAYAALMRDEYPPFRLDTGPDEAQTGLAGPLPAPSTPALGTAHDAPSPRAVLGGPAIQKEDTCSPPTRSPASSPSPASPSSEPLTRRATSVARSTAVLKAHGHEVVAVNPNATQVDGDPSYPDLASVPGALGGVLVMVKAADAVRDRPRVPRHAGRPHLALQGDRRTGRLVG